MFKPYLAALVLPPLGPLLLAALGLFFAARKQRAGLLVAGLALVLLWLLSCHGAAVWLARALPQFAPVMPLDLKTAQVQAIVILGGGVQPVAPEYGEPQLRSATAERLRYGLHLAQQTGLPVAFSGGIGWAASENQSQSQSEAAVA
ncbi:MAG: YdcF family protein, partial [Polaromonas sp.]|nr:YdcF family protein [Polaromonas sp.]